MSISKTNTNIDSSNNSLSILESTFPAVEISKLAEVESWRKEVYRPATHTHKWWAKRLGTVFRSIIIESLNYSGNEPTLYDTKKNEFSDIVLFDPFAGSGTTLVESVKLGLRTIGRDINPVATLVQRQAVAEWNIEKLKAAFGMIESACKTELNSYYVNEDGETVLYYFWVAQANCPDCDVVVDLFSSKIFAKHAYASKHPESKAICVTCGDIVITDYRSSEFVCKNGHHNQTLGSVKGQNMTCSNGHVNKVLFALKGKRPSYRMYAKLVLNKMNKKVYQSIDSFDEKLYKEIESKYQLLKADIVSPTGNLEVGINTRQAKSWGFDKWEDFFNTRQLLSLGLIGKAIKELDVDESIKEALTTLFSGTLEFNNLFCSFKGEGTGAVRHMFSNHTLKPERVPLEANPWGTNYSSGSFSTLFKSRLIRAYEYKKHPSDLALNDSVVKKVGGLSLPLNLDIAESWTEFITNKSSAYIVSGDSSNTDIADKAVDLIITDPPYMDNVNYSELADFFHAWLKNIQPYKSYDNSVSTRSDNEVQSANPDDFSKAIERVWTECERVLKDDGLVAFTFHQARISGWIALVKALKNAGLTITSIQPIKGEMSNSITKAGATNPSNLDSIVICRKSSYVTKSESMDVSLDTMINKLAALKESGIKVGLTDVTSVVNGTVLSYYTINDEFSIEQLVELAAVQYEKASDKLLSIST